MARTAELEEIKDSEAAVLRLLINAPLSHSGNKKARNAVMAYLTEKQNGEISEETVRVALMVIQERATTEVTKMCDFIINKFLDGMLSKVGKEYQVPEASKVW